MKDKPPAEWLGDEKGGLKLVQEELSGHEHQAAAPQRTWV